MEGRQPRWRVLWVTEEAPDQALGGGNIRQAQLFHHLAREMPTHLLVVEPVHDELVRGVASGITQLTPRSTRQISHPVGRRARDLALTMGSPNPLRLHAARPARRALARAIASIERSYDLVCVEHETLAPLIPSVRRIPWIVTFHHLLSGMLEKELELAPGRRHRWIRARDLDKARRLEARALRSYDRVVLCSEQDAAQLITAAPDARRRLAVIPNGVDLARYQPSQIPAEPRILLPGTLAWAPNVDGAVWFCTEVWPRVRAVMPAASVVLAGRSPVSEVRKLDRVPGVSVEADVPSMVPYFARARLVVVPLRIGTGTRLKALEAMSAGRPVVGTTIGLDGLGIVDGVQALVADDADSTAEAVLSLLQDDCLANAIARAGRSHVERNFGWDRIGEQFVSVVSGVLDEAAASQPSERSSSRAA